VHRLRDLAAADQVFQVGGDVFPPLRSVDVVPTNLPTTRTELVGRSSEVAALAALSAKERLITLTGVGGVGKTRLALGVDAAVAPDYGDGCRRYRRLARFASLNEAFHVLADQLAADAGQGDSHPRRGLAQTLRSGAWKYEADEGSLRVFLFLAHWSGRRRNTMKSSRRR